MKRPSPEENNPQAKRAKPSEPYPADLEVLIRQEQLNQLLLDAVRKNNSKVIIQLLIDDGADVNTTGQVKDFLGEYYEEPVLHTALYYDYTDIAKLLISTPGINLNATGFYGTTALHIAVKKSNKELVELLVNGRDININNQDKQGHTALHVALRCYETLYNKKNTEIITTLIDAGINLNIANKYGETALRLAISGFRDVVLHKKNYTEKLLDAGANVKALSSSGNKPHYYAHNIPSKQYTMASDLEQIEKDLESVAINPSIKQSQLKLSKTAYIKMLYHGALYKSNEKLANKGILENPSYIVDTYTAYSYFTKNNLLDEFDKIAKNHALTKQELKTISEFFPTKNILMRQQALLMTQRNQEFADLIVHCKQ